MAAANSRSGAGDRRRARGRLIRLDSRMALGHYRRPAPVSSRRASRGDPSGRAAASWRERSEPRCSRVPPSAARDGAGVSAPFSPGDAGRSFAQALWTFPSILLSAFIVAWAAEAAQFYISQGLALAL